MAIMELDCFTSFYQEKDQPAVCGIVISDGEKKKIYLEHRLEGDYLNGLLSLLIAWISFAMTKLPDDTLHLDVHIHHKNSNFTKVLDKVRTAARTGYGYKGEELENIIKHILVKKSYNKPACYEKMVQLTKLLIEINDPVHRLILTNCEDSISPDQLAIYAACMGKWNDLKSVPAAATP